MRRRTAGLVASLLAAWLIVTSPGCVSWGRASFQTYDWTFATFQENPVAQFPFYVGFFLFALVGAPLDLISWPLTVIFFDEKEKELSAEHYWFSIVGPSVFLGAAGGVILGGIFYPFGLPFMGDSSEPEEWSNVPPPPDDQPLPPPPGGDEPPGKK